MSHLPSLQTLRAFEAAGRLRSYSKAAAELGLTHGAVSHRIRELEQRLGLSLFKRVGNAMALTLDGQKLIVKVRQGLALLEQAFEQPLEGGARAQRTIVVSGVPSLSSTWLFARIGEYRSVAPEIDIELRVGDRLVEFKREGVDLGFRLGQGGWPGVNAAKLFDEALTPVCTPAYRDKIGLREPKDLARATLMRNAWTPWSRWFRAVGLDWPEPKSGPAIDDSALLLRAAIDQGGVVLARHWLAVDELRAGRLVAPFDVSVQDDFSYWVVWPTGRTVNPAALAFREWLLARAAAEEPPCPGLREHVVAV